MRFLEALAPAKLNLALAVGRVREDGYHDLATLFQTVGLCDRVRVLFDDGPVGRADPGRVDVRVRGPAAAGVPAGPDNLAGRAVQALARRFGREAAARMRRVTIHKRIPAGAGLGGGSSDAAAVLRLFGYAAGQADAGGLLEAAAEVGADVPFLMRGGTAAGFERGERLRPLPPLPPRPVVLVMPARTLSTRSVYDALDRTRGAADPGDPESSSRWQAVVGALALGDEGALWRAAFNDLEEPALELAPEIAPRLDAVRRAGALAAGVSGSGSAVWGVMPTFARARRFAAERRRAGDWAWAGRLLARLPGIRLVRANSA